MPLICEGMPNKKTLPVKLGDGLKQTPLRAVANARFLARCVSCYMQVQREYNELAEMNYLCLRDIGLTPHDVKAMTRPPVWRRCWRWVLSCPSLRCRGSAMCVGDCRRK